MRPLVLREISPVPALYIVRVGSEKIGCVSLGIQRFNAAKPPFYSCVRQVQQLVMVRVVRFIQVNKQHPFVRSETTIPSSRPAFRQSAARSGSQGCRRERGGTGGAGAKGS